MPDAPATFTSSQGFSAFSVSGATKVSIKVTRKSDVLPLLDNSTLALSHGAGRTYESGLKDLGQNSIGTVVTVTIEGLGAAPTKGTTISAEGSTCMCMESTDDDSAGDLHKYSATYTSDYAA